jgi:CubicO group peptidase (beta-lactamase class C family)
LARIVAQVHSWPVDRASVAVLSNGEILASHGDLERPYALASVTKLFTAFAALIAVEEGTLDLDGAVYLPVDSAAPVRVTVRHLFAHASGLPFEGVAPGMPEERRIYSNTGYELLGALLADAAEMPFATYLREALFEPLEMARSNLHFSPARDGESTVNDLCRFVNECRHPVLLSEQTVSEMRTEQFQNLSGLVPGFGTFIPCPWGLGPELHGTKGIASLHWMGSVTSPQTWGHFGASGTFVWVDPTTDLAVVALTDREFGPWARVVWPAFSDDLARAWMTPAK